MCGKTMERMEKQEGHEGRPGHQANCIRVEGLEEARVQSPDGRGEATRKTRSSGLDATCKQHEQMLPCAHTQIHTTSTRYKQIRETTTGEDK